MARNGSDGNWLDRNVKHLCLAAFAVGVGALAVFAFNTVSNGTVATAEPRPNAVASRTPEPVPTVAVTRPAGRPLQVLFAGDSLSAGLYASEQAKAFKYVMIDTLDDGGPVKEFNNAISGGTTAQVSESYPVPTGLDLAVIELGTNDVGNGASLEDFTADYTTLITNVTTANPGVPLVCAGIWKGDGSPRVDDFDATIKSTCEAAGGVYASLKSIYQAPANSGPEGVATFQGASDLFHPNDAGHAAIAERLLKRIAVV